MTKKKVTLYGSDGCHYCGETKKFLKEKKIPYTYKRVDGNAKVTKEMLAKNGGKVAVPTLIVGKKVIIGFAPDQIMEAWK